MDWDCHVEPVASILRVFNPGETYGKPYVFACTMRWIDNETVELCGVDQPPKLSMMRPIGQACADLGAKTIVIKRHGEMKTFDLSRL